MCSNYWNLNAEVICPSCGHTEIIGLQTHFMGDASCMEYYELGEPVPELKGVSVVLDGENDDFIAVCSKCPSFWDVGARIEDGHVVEVWNIVKLDGD